MQYELELTGTAATIGFCACVPRGEIDPVAAVDYLTTHPADEYMHKHLLSLLMVMDCDAIAALVERCGQSAVLCAALGEAALVRPEIRDVLPGDPDPASSPLVDLRQEALPAMAAHRAWSPIFADNLHSHKPLPASDCGAGAGLPALPFSREAIARSRAGLVAVSDIDPGSIRAGRGAKPVTAGEASKRAERALAAAGVEMSQQMRHQMSLAPVGLVRQWRLRIDVRNGGLDYGLSGIQSSFGRGLEFDAAQAALLMEMCERYSSWASIGPEGALGYARPLPLTRARLSSLAPGAALDPASLPLEAPYADEPIHWVPATKPDGTSILVPAQCVFMFANLDEPAFFSGLGSTGLGAGCCVERARLTALLEVVERDAESVSPHDPARCFRISSGDKKLRVQLEDYARRGMDVWFEDITSELGVPCYRAFAVGPEGQVMKGASAGLDGARACVSAMFEVPYPYPFGPPTTPGPENLPVRRLEELPSLSTGSFAGDLALMEAALAASGIVPAYVDLTRADMGIPVCRALVPGLELMTDFDRHSILSPRLFARWLGAAAGPGPA